MKKWIKADNGRVTQVIKFNDGSKVSDGTLWEVHTAL